MHENCVSNFWLWTTELGLALLATKKIQLAKKPRKQCMVFYHHAVTLHVITDYKNVFREEYEAPFSTFDSLWLAANWIKCLCNMKTLVHILEFVAFRTRKQSLEWVASCKPDFCFDLQTAMKTCSLIFPDVHEESASSIYASEFFNFWLNAIFNAHLVHSE